MWNCLPEYVVNAPSVKIVHDYKAAAWHHAAGRNIFAPAGTQTPSIEAKACGHEDT